MLGAAGLEQTLRLPIAEDLIQVLGIQYPISPALQVLHCGGVQPLLYPRSEGVTQV
jgi:hypothetical protein